MSGVKLIPDPIPARAEIPGGPADHFLMETMPASEPAIELVRDLHPSSPFRRPDWRWRLAQHLLLRPRSRLRKLADDPVRAALEYLRILRGCRGDRGRRRLAESMVDIHGARTLSVEIPAQRRHEIGARLLAVQDDATIAERCGLPPEIVDSYSKLFFDVRDRLHARSYIQHVVIGPLDRDHGAIDLGRLWKLVGFCGGTHVLDAVLAFGYWKSDPGRDHEVAHPGCARGIALLLAALQLPVDSSTGRQLLLLESRRRELERAAWARSAAAVSGPVMAAIEPEIAREVDSKVLQTIPAAEGNFVPATGVDLALDTEDWCGVDVAILKYSEIDHAPVPMTSAAM